MVGLGIDAVDIERFTHWSTCSHTKLKRLYTPDELLLLLQRTGKICRAICSSLCCERSPVQGVQSSRLASPLPLLALFPLCEVSLTTEYHPSPPVGESWSAEQSILLSLTHTKSTAIAVVLLTQRLGFMRQTRIVHCYVANRTF